MSRTFTPLPRRSDALGNLCRVPICDGRPTGRRTSFCSRRCSLIFAYFFLSFRDGVGYFGKWVCAICEAKCAEVLWDAVADGTYPVLQELQPWEADHIVPVVEGGPTTFGNGRVLCLPCHRHETRKLRARLARPQPLAR